MRWFLNFELNKLLGKKGLSAIHSVFKKERLTVLLTVLFSLELRKPVLVIHAEPV